MLRNAQRDDGSDGVHRGGDPGRSPDAEALDQRGFAQQCANDCTERVPAVEASEHGTKARIDRGESLDQNGQGGPHGGRGQQEE